MPVLQTVPSNPIDASSWAVHGLELANFSTDSIDIGIGTCISSDGTASMARTSSITKSEGAWAVGHLNGGLDDGTSTYANSTWYFVYLIKRIDTGVVDAIFSTDNSAPTLPTNYTVYRRIGAFLTDGSGNINGFWQVGDRFYWDSDPITDVSVTATPTNWNHIALTVPPLAGIYAFGTATLQNTDGGGTSAGIGAAIASGMATVNTFSNYYDAHVVLENYVLATSQATQVIVPFELQVDALSQILHIINNNANVSHAKLIIKTSGWVDKLGRTIS